MAAAAAGGHWAAMSIDPQVQYYINVLIREKMLKKTQEHKKFTKSIMNI